MKVKPTAHHQDFMKTEELCRHDNSRDGIKKEKNFMLCVYWPLTSLVLASAGKKTDFLINKNARIKPV